MSDMQTINPDRQVFVSVLKIPADKFSASTFTDRCHKVNSLPFRGYATGTLKISTEATEHYKGDVREWELRDVIVHRPLGWQYAAICSNGDRVPLSMHQEADFNLMTWNFVTDHSPA